MSTDPVLKNIPKILRGIPRWVVCGEPVNRPNESKAPLDPSTGYASWDCLYDTPEAAYEAMKKTKNAKYIGFLFGEPIIIDGKLLICADFDFKNPTITVCQDVPRHNDGQLLADFIISCSTYAEFSVSNMGYHIWMLAEVPVPDKNIDDTFGVGMFFKRHNIVFTGKTIPGSQDDIHGIPINVLKKINTWTKGPHVEGEGTHTHTDGKKFELPDEILDGNKHNCFRSLTLKLANSGLSVDEIFHTCVSMNENGRVRPPIPTGDMDTRVRELCKSAVKKVEKEKIEKTKNPEYAKLYRYELVARGDGLVQKIVLDFIEIVEWLHKKHHTISFENELYTYENGVYVPNSNLCENEIRVFLKTISYQGAIMGIVREVINRLKIYEPCRDYPFNRQDGILPVANGVLVFDFDNDKVELKEHSPEYLFTLKLPVVFNPKASGQAFRENVLSKYVDEEKLPVLYMAPAMAILQLIKKRVFKKSLICEGESNSGKTTYLEWLIQLFGLKYCASISLHEIAEDRFAFAQLEGKILNNYDELSDMQINEIEKFKKLTGRQDHKIEKKGVDGYDTILTAFHLFATNRPPSVSENIMYDAAFWNRWIYLHFDNIFDVDLKFKETWFTEENISGSFNDVIAMVMEIERAGLPYTQDPSTVKEEWNNAAEPFLAFMKETMCDSEERVIFQKNTLFTTFDKWCQEHNIPGRKIPGTITSFSQLAFKHGFNTVQKNQKGVRDWVYKANKKWVDGPYKPVDETKDIDPADSSLEKFVKEP